RAWARGWPASSVMTLPLRKTKSGGPSGTAPLGWRRIMSRDATILHHETQPAQVRNIRRWITVDRDQVGQLACLQGAEAIGGFQPLGRLDGCCAQRVQ